MPLDLAHANTLRHALRPTNDKEPMSASASPLTARRREFRNISIEQIVRYRLPPAGMVSILHRASGALLFLALPLVLWLFDLSLMSESSFLRLREFASGWIARLVLLALIWALLHHFAAGVRYLLLDLHVAIERAAAQRSALAVYAVSLPLTLLAAFKLFGVF